MKNKRIGVSKSHDFSRCGAGRPWIMNSAVEGLSKCAVKEEQEIG